MNQQTAEQPNSLPACGTESAARRDRLRKPRRSPIPSTRAKDSIGELAREVLTARWWSPTTSSATIDARVAELDWLIFAQLSAVMHAPEFQRMESTWRGLDYLCKESNTGSTVKIKAPHAPKRDLVRLRDRD